MKEFNLKQLIVCFIAESAELDLNCHPGQSAEITLTTYEKLFYRRPEARRSMV
ncbi:hypothetical protein QFZ34_001186 [Phyllobacterium ifriqiyense]|uniref:Uncharacterized protein n=1 Tax=Phyllobacterium ifriqiyense TaxID=314238 RepID=A0ABU0S5J8_9HYPH|nr:hypothetical protein [Phyllobacterium ifriqiyense]